MRRMSTGRPISYQSAHIAAAWSGWDIASIVFRHEEFAELLG